MGFLIRLCLSDMCKTQGNILSILIINYLLWMPRKLDK